jgi:uncharacterized protein with GYD domain
MIFVVLYKFRRKLTKDDIAKANKVFSGVKTIGVWWTLGRFDAVRIFEARDEKDAMRLNLALEGASSETLVAVDRAEAVKLLG